MGRAEGRTYLRSPDVGRIDEDGFVHISGRVKDTRATHDKVLKRALRDPYWEGISRQI